MVSDCLSINERGHLAMDGRDTLELASKYGTPLYVMSEMQIRRACRQFRHAIDTHYAGNGTVLYASKAMCCKGICAIMAEEKLGLDVVSGGELYTALAGGFPAQRMFFHGSNKTPAELQYALQSKVGTIVVDNFAELALLEQLADRMGMRQNIFLRIKPGVDAHTHDWIRTGGIDSKFGFALETGEAFAAADQVLQCKNLSLAGLHFHIGSQIFDPEPFALAARITIGFMAEIQSRLGYTIQNLNLGGGFGIRYLAHQSASPSEQCIARMAQVIKECCANTNFPQPHILIEPGRAIAGPAGITLYTVGAIKEIPNRRTYLSVDGGMNDNPRYALYRAEYEMLLANKATQQKQTTVTIAGHCCENDLLAEHIPLQPPAIGDILAVLATGAYNYSMASNYNRFPRPPVVLVGENGDDRLLVRRETYEDVAHFDL